MFPSILIFDFDVILGSFLTFWGPNELFLGFWGLLIKTNNFCFQSIALFLLYHVVLSLCGVGGWVWVVVFPAFT